MRTFAAAFAMFCCATALALPPDRGVREGEPAQPDWRAAALRTMRVAPGDVIAHPATLALYRDAGLNTVMVYDADSYDAARLAWNHKTEEQIRSTTMFARVNRLPLVVGLEIEPFDGIPQASDDELRARLSVWRTYGDDIILGVSPWYDDVFWQHVDAARQRHVYALIKEAAPEWYVFGIVGEFGLSAPDDDVARYYEPAAFDHLAVLLYPFSVGVTVSGFTADTIGSADPDGDITRYVDRFFAQMTDRFFSRLHGRQQILLVVQAFWYLHEPLEHMPRANDVRIMVERGTEHVRSIAGQQMNASVGYCCWGADGSPFAGLADRPDWLIAARDLDQRLARRQR